jgi:hypothetical protein
MIGFQNPLDRMLNGSVGMQVNRMLDRLGLPDKLGDVIGARIDLQRGDLQGAMRNLADATSNMTTAQRDSIFGQGLPPAGFVPRPMDFMAAHSSFATGGAFGPGMGAHTIGHGFNPFGGVSHEAPFGVGSMGRSVERMCDPNSALYNPVVRHSVERSLGGTIIPDGRRDGVLTVYRSPFQQVGGLMRNAFSNGLLPQVGLAATLAGVGVPFAGALAANAVTGGILRGLQRMEANISGLAGRMTQSHNELLADPQAHTMAQGMGIDLRTASFEDILFLLLMKYAKKKEDDIMKKVQELDKSTQAGNKKQAKGGLGGLLGPVGGIVGNVIAPGVGGMVGSAAGQMVGGALSSMGGGGGSAGGMYGGNLGESMDPSKMSDTMKQQMLQKLMGDLQKLYEMLSNMIKSMHDMQMTPTRNLRG